MVLVILLGNCIVRSGPCVLLLYFSFYVHLFMLALWDTVRETIWGANKMPISVNNILDNYGGQDKHSLLHLLQDSNDENLQDEPIIIFENTKYIDNETLVDTLKEKHLVFKVLSLNCQSMCMWFGSASQRTASGAGRRRESSPALSRRPCGAQPRRARRLDACSEPREALLWHSHCR